MSNYIPIQTINRYVSKSRARGVFGTVNDFPGFINLGK